MDPTLVENTVRVEVVEMGVAIGVCGFLLFVWYSTCALGYNVLPLVCLDRICECGHVVVSLLSMLSRLRILEYLRVCYSI